MDLVIALFVALIQAILGFAGVLVSLKRWGDTAKLRFVIAFVALSLIGIGMVSWQAYRSVQGGEENKRLVLGDSEHPPFVSVMSLPGVTHFVVTNNSDYPAYGIRIRLVDDRTGMSPVVIRDWNYQELSAHTALLDDNPWIPQLGTVAYHFSAAITTRTGVVNEELILRKTDNNQWARAARITMGMRTLEEDVDSAWPRNSEGKVDW
jgi:hypothetical protein